MDELKLDLNNSKDCKLYKEAWKHFIHCKDIDEINSCILMILYLIKNSLDLKIQMVFYFIGLLITCSELIYLKMDAPHLQIHVLEIDLLFLVILSLLFNLL